MYTIVLAIVHTCPVLSCSLAVWEVPASGTVRLEVSLAFRREQGGHARSRGCVHAQRRAGINSYRLFVTDTRQKQKKLLKLRTAIVLLTGQLGSTSVDTFIGLR